MKPTVICILLYFFFSLSKTPIFVSACYNWYIISNSSALEMNIAEISYANIWIYDQARASTSELAQNATMPSVISGQLTLQLSTLGGFPRIAQFNGDGSMIIEQQPVFETESKTWRMAIRAIQPGVIPVTVHGNNVSLFSCGVDDLQQEWFAVAPLPSVLSDHAVALTVGSFRFSCQGCNPALCALHSPNNGLRFILSRSRFTSSSVVSLDAAHVGGATALSDVLVGHNNLLVVANGTVFWFSLVTNEFNQSTGLPGSVFLLRTFSGCDHTKTATNSSSQTNFFVVAFSSVNTSEMYMSLDGGVSFISQPLPDALPIQSVLDSAIMLPGPSIAVLVRTIHGDEVVLVWSNTTSTWAIGQNLRGVVSQKGASPQLTPALSGTAELFVWGAALYYSSDIGQTLAPVRLYQGQTQVFLGDTEVFTQVLVDRRGRLACLTSSNRVFYGGAGILSLAEIMLGDAATTMRLQFDSFGSLYTVVMRASGDINVTLVDISTVMAQTFPTCPYSSLTSQQPAVMYFDLNDSKQFNVSLTGPLTSTRISVSVSNSSLLNVTSISHVELTSQKQQNRTVTVTVRETGSHLTSTHSVIVETHSANPRCAAIERVTQARVGCIPNRSLRLRSSAFTVSSRCDSLRAGATYNVESGRAAGPLYGLTYDYNTYGCPIFARHDTDGFRPVFDIYDDDVMTKQVTAGIVVWEQNNRTDFRYNTTAQQAGCLSEPQSWTSMLAMNPDPVQAWTPNNYRSCFVGPASEYTDTVYQVLNSTSNALIWTGFTGEGLFLFRARIIDPSFTYCDLSTYFAVDVVGAPVAGWVVGTIMGAATGSLLILVCLAGLYYVSTAKVKTQ